MVEFLARQLENICLFCGTGLENIINFINATEILEGCQANDKYVQCLEIMTLALWGYCKSYTNKWKRDCV